MTVFPLPRYTREVMFENRRTSRPFDLIGPFDPHNYTFDVPIGNNNPTNVQARIYDTPGNTPLNKAKGGLFEEPGKYKYSGNPYADTWFTGGELKR